MNADANQASADLSVSRGAAISTGLLAVVTLVLLLRRIWQPADVLLDGPLVDDFFYYLQVAWNYTESGSLSLDGRNTTNGFHPLFMGILLALKPFAGADKLRYAQLGLSVLAVAHVITGIYLARAFK